MHNRQNSNAKKNKIKQTNKRTCTQMFIAGQVIYYFVIFQTLSRMKIAVIGQSLFGADVYKLLQKDGHKIVGVFTVPDVNGKPDPLGEFMVCAVINCDMF